MSQPNMSGHMEKLLDGVEVEWRPLDTVFDIFAGGDVPKESFSEIETQEFNIPILSNGIGDKALYGWTDRAKIEKPSITISARGTIGWTNYVDKPFFPIVRLLVLTPKIEVDLKFSYYFMKTVESDYKVPPAGIPQLTKPMLKDVRIPIPCPDNPEKSLEIQAEIVRILDAFTAMTAELAAELAAELNLRKQQYNYYRDQLLSFEEGEVEWKTLGRIGTWYGGGTPSKSRPDFWENGTIPWVSPKDMGSPIVNSSEDYITKEAIKNSSTKLVPAGSIAIVVRSSILDKKLPSALIPVPVTLNQDMKAVIPNSTILPGYIAHMISSRGNDILRAAKKTGGSVASIDSKKLFSFRIPIPDLDEQQRIVSILDKFDTLANSITEGLPREIELRQKHYEYYRDRLLSFPGAKEEAVA